ncbi:hypothetical protein [Methylobacterium sp. yr596]|uniref:hypothetical protein n=1 Tax=Methylobacterium sp. yr596 TaxID=1761800 RepID=UPI0008E17DBA|nr:hypothetical protein [Methylobacterium sp. yr596]SFE20233.1 hypothetical protein SAMN04487844_101406 [Methylobacterium sp. yr596]
MIARALRIGTFPQLAAARTTGRYLGLNGQMYNIVWDAATSRLLVYLLGGSFTEIQSAVSSQAQAAVRTPTGQVGVYNVGSTGLVGDPVASYAVPTTPSGYQLHSYLANADVLFTGNATSNQAGFLIRNLATGASSGAIAGYATLSTAANTYRTGDAWLTQIPQANRLGAGSPFDLYTENGRRLVRLNYSVQSGAFPVLGRIAAPSIAALPLTGVPRVLGGASTVDAVSILLRAADVALCRAGQVFIPALATTRELDVRDDGAGRYIVSVAEAEWYGYVRADATSSTFVPLSAFYGYRTGVTCAAVPQQNGSVIYQPVGQDFTFTQLGPPNLSLHGILTGIAALWRNTGTAAPASTAMLPAHLKTVRTGDGSTVVDTDVGGTISSAGSVFALPHLGALVRWTDDQFSDTAIIQISFDAGVTWKQGTAFRSPSNNAAPTTRGAPYAALRAAIPLFIV